MRILNITINPIVGNTNINNSVISFALKDISYHNFQTHFNPGNAGIGQKFLPEEDKHK
jgi:hypothetical protein